MLSIISFINVSIISLINNVRECKLTLHFQKLKNNISQKDF